MVTDQALFVVCNAPDETLARRLAHDLVERRLAACVNVLAPCRSVFWWQGKIEEADEVPLFIKTTAIHYPALQEVIREMHPYEVPEILALSVAGGLPQYLAWMLTACESNNPSPNQN